jgi:hypothetical protein
MWRDLEQQVGISDQARPDQAVDPLSPAEAVAGLIRRPPDRRGRRVFRSSYLS